MPYDENRFKLKQTEILGLQSKEKGLNYLKQQAGVSDNIESKFLDPKAMLLALGKSTMSKVLPLPQRLGGAMPEVPSTTQAGPSPSPGVTGAIEAGGRGAINAAGSEALGSPLALVGAGAARVAASPETLLPARMVPFPALGKQIESSMEKFSTSRGIDKIDFKSIWEGIKNKLEFGKVTSSTRLDVLENLPPVLQKVNKIEDKLKQIQTNVQGIPELEKRAESTIENMMKVKETLLSKPPRQEILDLSRFDLGEESVKFKALTPQAQGIIGKGIYQLRDTISNSGVEGKSYISAINRAKTGGLSKTAKAIGIAGSGAAGLAALKKLLQPKEEKLFEQ